MKHAPAAEHQALSAQIGRAIAQPTEHALLSVKSRSGSQVSHSKKPRRTRGRPREASQGVGADAIVLQVCELLREVAPRDVTLLRVAQHARIDRSLIRYYFKNRPSLLLAAARHLFGQLQNELALAKQVPASDPERQVRESARALLRFQIKHPYFHRLMVDEVVNSEQADAQAFFKTFTASAVSEYRSAAAAISQHTGARSVDGAFLYMAVIGMCEFFVTGAPILKVAFGKEYDAAAVQRRYEKFIVQYVLDGLRKPMT
jgi:AcrR family transcriptional regulator